MIKVKVVNTVSDRKEFIEMYQTICEDNGNPIEENGVPFAGTSFVAYRGEKAVARCQAEVKNELGMIGYFQAKNDSLATTQLLMKAVDYLRQNGAKRVIGPMNGDTWHHYRFNLGPYKDKPFIKEPWNPVYYPELWFNAGFEVVDKYDSYVIKNCSEVADKQHKFYQRCCRNGYTFEEITPQNYDQLLPTIFKISSQIFADNRFYQTISYSEFEKLYAPLKKLTGNKLSWLAWDKKQQAAGFCFAFPNYAEGADPNYVCLKTLGVLQKDRGSGLSAALSYLTYFNGSNSGYKSIYMCLMHADNDSHRLSSGLHEPFRDYALLEYKL